MIFGYWPVSAIFLSLSLSARTDIKYRSAFSVENRQILDRYTRHERFALGRIACLRIHFGRLAMPQRKWTAIRFFLYNSPRDCQGQQHSEPMAILYSYKMSHDDRFAPNPYFGVLTLATCMSRMRYNTPVGEWIAGWISMRTLIYLAKVSEKLTLIINR